ncbi:MAG: hypothetical protein K0Q57_678 [Gammaproteobacteria bacterium]|jgi:predicted DNA binding CopG/RHH family protein|nr:hypothetical protein [Gammaproteobacteria bacterium]
MNAKANKQSKLDQEEKEILAAFENGKLKRVKNFEATKKLAEKAATNYLRKNSRINIRIPSGDLERIKQIAAYEGLPYQTLIASVLHKYAAGHLN